MTHRLRLGRTETKTKTQLRTYSSLDTWISLISTGFSWVRCKCIRTDRALEIKQKSLDLSRLFCLSKTLPPLFKGKSLI